jgi:hypothetical protein
MTQVSDISLGLGMLPAGRLSCLCPGEPMPVSDVRLDPRDLVHKSVHAVTAQSVFAAAVTSVFSFGVKWVQARFLFPESSGYERLYVAMHKHNTAYVAGC